MKEKISANFFLKGKARQFAFRGMYHCPRVGDLAVFDDVRYTVLRIEWCMDEGACNLGGQRVNIELEET